MGRRHYWIISAVGCIAVTAALLAAAARENKPAPASIQNPDFTQHSSDGIPAGYTLTGQVRGQVVGDPRRDSTTWGVAMRSTGSAGSISQTVSHFAGNAMRSYRFSIYALPQDHFSVQNDALYLKVEFLGSGGAKTFDAKTKPIYPLIQQARHDLEVNGVNHAGGAAVWTTYSLDFVIPFAEVDQVRLSVNFENGNGRSTATDGSGADFYVARFTLTPLVTKPPTGANAADADHDRTHLIPLGGRWFYAATADESAAPSNFDFRNATRLLYHDGQYTAPFAGMMTSVLRAGEKDRNGNIVTQDQPADDNVTMQFQSGKLIIHSRGLPNHPTGKFPESGFGRGFNPNFITEQIETYSIPLDPQINSNHYVTDTTNSNHALPMGPIGIAVNGIVFFNPFDAGNQDATDMMDRCCGHPNQDGQYHYHKYPICVNSPWSDQGEGHSPLLGFAFDGFPIYGPYESTGVMAKDVSGESKLNAFNMHYDEARGWHYHVTPGKFPYIIGGYWGTEDPADRQRPRHIGGGPGGRGPGGEQIGGGPNGGRDRGGSGMMSRQQRGQFPPPRF